MKLNLLFSLFPWWRRRKRPARRCRPYRKWWFRWRAGEWRRRGLCWEGAEWVFWFYLVGGKTRRRQRWSVGGKQRSLSGRRSKDVSRLELRRTSGGLVSTSLSSSDCYWVLLLNTFSETIYRRIGHVQGTDHDLGTDISHVQGTDHDLSTDMGHMQGTDHDLSTDIGHMQGTDHDLSTDMGHVQGTDHDLSTDIGHVRGTDHDLGLPGVRHLAVIKVIPLAVVLVLGVAGVWKMENLKVEHDLRLETPWTGLCHSMLFIQTGNIPIVMYVLTTYNGHIYIYE